MDYETNRIITQEELNKMGEELSNYAESQINQQFSKISNDMNYEQKYKEANDKVAARFGTNVAKEIFTDLYESEDERIRKCITLLVNGLTNEHFVRCGASLDEIEVWLEKRNETFTKKDVDDAYVEGMAFAKNELEKQGEQKPTDKVEPKFHKGQWIIWQDKCYKVNYNGCGYELIDQNGLRTSLEYGTVDKSARLLTIDDAKEGDVLAYVTDEEDLWIMIYWSLYKPYEGHVHYHALLANDNFSDKGTCCICINDLKPATKEQRDTLFAKMEEAGYEWDSEKKELKKIENEIEIPFGAKDSELQEATYYIPKGFHAEIEGNNVIIKKGEQKPAWSEEDEKMWAQVINEIEAIKKNSSTIFEKNIAQDKIDWLKSIKDKVQPQLKREWSEEDAGFLNLLLAIFTNEHPNGVFTTDNISVFKGNCVTSNRIIAWLKSLRHQNTWKPNDEQIACLHDAVARYNQEGFSAATLTSLLKQLKKLREE